MNGRIAAGWCLGWVVLIVSAVPASAKILKTRQASQSQPLEITVGSGVEFQKDSEQSEFGFSFLFEWRPMSRLQLTIEPQYTVLRSTIGESASGVGDPETSLTWDFVTERRYRPLFSAIALVKWPTAKGELGTGEKDYTLGGIISKEFATWDLEFNVGYTWVGSPPDERLKNSLEFALAAEWHLTSTLDLEAEIDTSSGGVRGQPGSIGGIGSGTDGGGGRESEATIGLAHLLTHRFKLEEGVVVQADGGWQLVFAWEFDFGGGR